MNTLLRLTVSTMQTDSNEAILSRISSQVEELGDQNEWPPKLVYLVNLTLEEFGLNALTHGRAQGLDQFKITIKSGEDDIFIEMSDNGAPFDPLNDAPTPDLDAPIDTRPIGGLGIYLIRKMVDDLWYRREGDRNYVTLITRRTQ